MAYPPAWIRLVVSWNVPSIVGFLAAIVGLGRYVSFSQQTVLGRWTPQFAGMLAVFLMAWVLFSFLSIRREVSSGQDAPAFVERAALNMAVLFWGLAYLTSSLLDPVWAGKILGLNFMGSRIPLAVALENLALLSLFVAVIVRVYRWRTSKWVNPALVVATLLALLVLGETAARAKALVFPAPQAYPTYSGQLWRWRHVDLNSMGFRDREHDLDSELPRLLVVGDSYAFGWGVNDIDDRFGEVLTSLVSEETGVEWESLNASAGDRNTIQEIGYLERMAAFEPDVIILLYYFNDMNYIIPETGSGLVEKSQYHPGHVLFKNSFLFQELYVRTRALIRRMQGIPLSRVYVDSPYADSTALQRHLGDLERFVSIARETGAITAIVPFDYGATEGGPTRERYDVFVNSALARGLPVWPIYDTFEGHEFLDLAVNRLDMHPNEIAHRLAAESVAGRVVEALEMQRDTTGTADVGTGP